LDQREHEHLNGPSHVTRSRVFDLSGQIAADKSKLERLAELEESLSRMTTAMFLWCVVNRLTAFEVTTVAGIKTQRDIARRKKKWKISSVTFGKAKRLD
jgi:hypothetical protein